MTSREQFEAQIRLHTDESEIEDRLEKANGGLNYAHPETDVAWIWWQASREAVEVELPEPHAHVIWVQAGNAPDDYWDDVEISRSEQDKCCDGSDRYPVYARHEVVSMLDSAGIKVKGE